MQNFKLTEDAISRLRQVKAHILEEPNRLIMADWYKRVEDGIANDTLSGAGGYSEPRVVVVRPPCGTAACIAGWVCLLDRNFNPREQIACGLESDAILGILRSYDACNNTWRESGEELYQTKNWPREIREEFATTDLLARAIAAGKAIEWFISLHS